jgi:hypothetical protein
MPLTEKGQKIKSALTKRYGEERGERILYAGKNKGTFTGIDRVVPTQAPGMTTNDWQSPRQPAVKDQMTTLPNAGMPQGKRKDDDKWKSPRQPAVKDMAMPVRPATHDWQSPRQPGQLPADNTHGQTPRPGMVGGSPTTVGRAGQQMDQPPLSRPRPLVAGGFREPHLTEAGNVRLPPHAMPPRGGTTSPLRFDAVENPHPPVDPVAEAAEYAAGITGNPTASESASAKNDHAKAQVFHERMARFHEARGEQNHAAAHMAASTAHQSAAAFDKGSYRRGVTADQLGSNARDRSVHANHMSGFGRGFGSNDMAMPVRPATHDMTPPGTPIMPHQLPADQPSQSAGGRYHLVDRMTGDTFDVEVPDHVNFTKDVSAERVTMPPVKVPPLKPRPLEAQTLHGTTRDHGGWASPSFPADAGTSAGARKAAQTRAAGGGAPPSTAPRAAAAPKAAVAAPKAAVAAPKAAVAAPKAAVAAPKAAVAAPHPAAPAAPKATVPSRALAAAAPAVKGVAGGVRGAASLTKGLARGIERAGRFSEEYR